MDMWSFHDMTPYMGLIAHWIDKWNLIGRYLGTKFVLEDYTATELGECIDFMMHWKLDQEMLTTMTTDNAANIVKACWDKNWCNIAWPQLAFCNY